MQRIARYALVLVCTILATFLYWNLYGKPMIGIDDANIYFAYVKNYMEGYGFVYSAGGERVEGFTSILWVLLIGPLYLLREHFEVAILVLNVFIISICLFISITFINRITESKHFVSIPALLFLSVITLIPGYFDWTVLTLMETGLWSLLLTAISILLCKETFARKETIYLSLLLALLLLTRPESILWSVVFTALAFMRMYLQKNSFAMALKAISGPIVSVVVTTIALTIFRMVYFGFPLPNTFYAKVSTNILYNVKEGIRYFAFCAIQSPILLLILLASILSLALIVYKLWSDSSQKFLREMSLATQIQFIVAAVSIVSILIPIYVGGDHFKLSRFYQPFMTIYLFLLFNLSFWRQFVAVKINIALGTWIKFLLMASFIPLIYLFTDTPLHTFIKLKSPIDGEFRLAEMGNEEGVKMNDFFSIMEELPSVGVSAAGGFGYAYSGQTVDLMGLNNVKMAHAITEKVGMKNHAAFDKGVFYQQKPEIFHGYKKISNFIDSPADTALLENELEFEEMHVYRLYKKLFFDSRFQKEYFTAVIINPSKTYYLKTYCRKEYAQKLMAKGYTVSEIKRTKLPLP